MKLLRLKINSPFNSLGSGFEIQFRRPVESGFSDQNNWHSFQPFCFVGRNGSGKSNVLEALANIFYHLESCVNINQSEHFRGNFSPKISFPDAFELEFYIRVGHIKTREMVKVSIVKTENEEPKMEYIAYPYSNREPVSVTLVKDENAKFPAPGKAFLPDLIAAYSSGENEILSIPFLKTRLVHFDEYEEALTRGYRYRAPESNLIYIDYEMSQAVLLSNFLLQSEKVLEPLKKELGIVGIKRFRMCLNLHDLNDKPIVSQLSPTITAFKNCSSARFENERRLILDFWVNDSTKEAFRRNFRSIFSLFRAFQILHTLNYRTVTPKLRTEVYKSKGFYTDGKVPSPELEEKVFYFEEYRISLDDVSTRSSLLLKNLSDGEQQFLHTLGICLMLANQRALLLLDEPETHFNPDWRSKFISILQKSLSAAKADDTAREVLITSHSPFIISDCAADKVIYFKKNGKTIEARTAQEYGFNTFGTSVEEIVEVLFGRRQTIGDLAKSRLKYNLSEVNTIEDVQRIKYQISDLGDSIEKDLLLASLNERKLGNA